jgi:hypothetical protein
MQNENTLEHTRKAGAVTRVTLLRLRGDVCLESRSAQRPSCAAIVGSMRSLRSKAMSLASRSAQVCSGRKPRQKARPAYLPTCDVRGRDLERQKYVNSVEKLDFSRRSQFKET